MNLRISRTAFFMATVFAASAASAQPAATGSGQEFPFKVVRLVVPFPAGGSNDVVARAMSNPLIQQIQKIAKAANIKLD